MKAKFNRKLSFIRKIEFNSIHFVRPIQVIGVTYAPFEMHSYSAFSSAIELVFPCTKVRCEMKSKKFNLHEFDFVRVSLRMRRISSNLFSKSKIPFFFIEIGFCFADEKNHFSRERCSEIEQNTIDFYISAKKKVLRNAFICSDRRKMALFSVLFDQRRELKWMHDYIAVFIFFCHFVLISSVAIEK